MTLNPSLEGKGIFSHDIYSKNILSIPAAIAPPNNLYVTSGVTVGWRTHII